MTCTRCGARLEADRTICGLCGAEQRGVASFSVPPYVDRGLASSDDVESEPTGPSIAVEEPPTPPAFVRPTSAPAARRPRSRWMWIAAVLAVALVTSGIVIVSVSGSLRAARGDLTDANDRVARTTAELNDARAQATGLEDELDSSRAANRRTQDLRDDAQVSLEACQDLFRMVVAFSRGMPSKSEQAEATALLISCFQGEIPPQLFP